MQNKRKICLVFWRWNSISESIIRVLVSIGIVPIHWEWEIGKNLVKFVGKEVTNLDATNTIGIAEKDNYTIYDNLADKILDIRPKDSYKFGISRSNLIAIQKKIRENGVVKLHKKTIEKIITGIIMVRGGDFTWWKMKIMKIQRLNLWLRNLKQLCRCNRRM